MKGRLIVIEGLDGSGKATQAALLQKALAAKGTKVRGVDFPRYGSPFCEPAAHYLKGALGSRPEDVNAYAASSFFAIDRYASYQQEWREFYQQGGLILADRYTTSNAVHQCSKMPAKDWAAFVEWLFDFEYRKLGIPAPDLVIYLDVNPAVSQQLMTRRYQGDESKKDIHEKDFQYLQRSHAAATWCARQFGWHIVHCCTADGMRGIEDIQQDVQKAVGLDGKGE